MKWEQAALKEKRAALDKVSYLNDWIDSLETQYNQAKRGVTEHREEKDRLVEQLASKEFELMSAKTEIEQLQGTLNARKRK